MKLAYIVYLAPLFAATACLASGDDPAATSEQGQFSQGGGGGGGAPPAATNLVSVSVTPNPLPGGHPASGILALSGLQGNGGGSTLTSSDPAVLTVPSEFFALATQSVGWFNVGDLPPRQLRGLRAHQQRRRPVLRSAADDVILRAAADLRPKQLRWHVADVQPAVAR